MRNTWVNLRDRIPGKRNPTSQKCILGSKAKIVLRNLRERNLDCGLWVRLPKTESEFTLHKLCRTSKSKGFVWPGGIVGTG